MITQSFGFSLITILIGLSHEADPSTDQDDGGTPMTMKGFNNTLGTFVEYTGRADLAFEDLTIYASFNFKSLLLDIQTLKKDYETLSGICMDNPNMCPKFFDLITFEDTFIKDGMIVTDLSMFFKGKSLFEDMNESIIIDSTRNVHQIVLERDSNEGTESPYRYIYGLTNKLNHLGTHLKRTRDAIVEAIVSAQQGRLSPLVLSINQLKGEMVKIQADLPPGRRLPFDQSTMSNIYRVATVFPQQMDNQVVFQIKVPLIDVDQFNMYRLTPIPRLDDGKIQMMDTETPYLCINDHQDRYFPLQNLDGCIELAGERFLCRNNQITYGNAGDSLACSLAAIKNQSSEACIFRQVEESIMWTQLVAPNSWMVALTKELSLMGVCSGESQELRINGTGILNIRSDCVVRTSAVTLQGKSPKSTPSKKGYASLRRINKSPRRRVNQLLEIVTQLRLDLEKLKAIEDYPIAVIAVCPIIVLIVVIISLVYLYRVHRRRQLTEAQNSLKEVNVLQDPKNENQSSNLPLLEKREI
ncbi:uncharacterized protein LOC108052608 [Drosophila rhopaloa]|uniref:Iris n=1 Tax=Drosophila rhopaloa TaxID=1041015 RepID=A0ABM5I5Q2_DRORH|nr:uncharacterized protein LOC108052608 [Drosophila rhopaloa]